MLTPAWTRWLFVTVLAVVCAFCLTRLVVLRRPRQAAGVAHWREDLTQVLMGVGMIAMFLSVSGVVPKPVWLVLFLGMAAGFAAPLLRGSGPATGNRAAGNRATGNGAGNEAGNRPNGNGAESWHCVQHVMAGLAMAYMLVAIGAPDAGGMSGMIALPPLAASFGVYFLGVTAWSGYRLVTGPGLAVAGGGPAVLRASRLVEGCRTVMGLGMAWMLLSMM